MSERTTIGGVSYETIGSSSSNLLLKCNGTARIQWGNKLIDLIKNGKLASENNSDKIFIVSNESDINSDGIYVLTADGGDQLWIYKNGEKYNLIRTDLYISANNKQDLTAEQKTQALENVGFYFNTLEELKKSEIKNGIVYVLDKQNLFTIKDGVVSDFTIKLNSVTVEQTKVEGDKINGSDKIVLTVADKTYIELSSGRILVDQPIQMKTAAAINSEGASSEKGYRIYIKSEIAYIETDTLIARKNISTPNIASIDGSTSSGFQLYESEGASYLDVDYINAREWTPFSKGMIMMFDGKADIPEGWAICDGKEHEYKGNKFITPNLIGRFIKAVETEEEVGAIDQEHLEADNTFTLTSEHLPEHSHPHNAHSHNISDIIGDLGDSGDLSGTLTDSNYVYNVSSDTVEVITTVTGQDISTSSTQVASNVAADTQGGTSVGGNHTHSLIISGGTISETQSEEAEVTWENKPFKIEPNAYALIFIIKL